MTSNDNSSGTVSDTHWGVGLDGFNYSEKAPASVLSIVWGLRKQFKIGSQIRHLTLPPSVCQPRSLLMKLADNFTRSYLLIGLNQEPSAELRFLQVLRVILSGYSLGPPPEAVRHVFNPVIGEHFECTFPNQDGSVTSFISEQISHHPPISAFVGMNDKHRFLLEGTVRPSYVHFLGNHCHSQVDGSLLIHLQEINESYHVTFPSFGVTGLLIGKTKIGYTGTMTVQCPQTGLRTTLELSYPKKQKDSTLTGDILNQQGSPICNLSGKWTGDLFITDLRTGVKSVFFSPTQYPIARPIMRPPQELDKLSSERVWQEVAEGIKFGKDDQALNGKLKLEQSQRDEEATRASSGTSHLPHLFSLDNSVSEGFFRYNFPTAIPVSATETAKPSRESSFAASTSVVSTNSPAVRR